MKICIDAGHNFSGFDVGAIGNGLREQDVTFKIAERLKQLLNLTQIPCIMTRDTTEKNLGVNVNDSLVQRVNIANNYKCDLFISIHCNSSTNKTAKGTETYIVGRGGEAEKIAEFVNSKIVKKLGLADRGVKVNNFYVLRKTQAPAILVETAFISNEKDALLLKEHYDGFAEAIYEGICEYYKITPMATQKKLLESPIDIVNKLSHQIVINDKAGAISALEKAKNENSSLYWILYKLVNK